MFNLYYSDGVNGWQLVRQSDYLEELIVAATHDPSESLSWHFHASLLSDHSFKPGMIATAYALGSGREAYRIVKEGH